MPYDVYSPMKINAYVLSSEVIACVSLFFGLFCIFTICRYSVRLMETGYKFHLLNITIWTLICDMNMSVALTPYPMQPMNGLCFMGELAQILEGRVWPESISKLGAVLFFFACMANFGALCNASIHKYLFVAGLVGKGEQKLPKIYINSLMVVIQLVWPIIGAICLLNINLSPAKSIEEEKMNHPDIFAWTVGRPCFLTAKDTNGLIMTYIFAGFLCVSHLIFCDITMLVMLRLCWQTILSAQNSTNVSKRRLKMQKKLLISLTVQCITPPLFILGLSVSSFIFGFILKMQFIKFLTQNIYLIISLHSVVNFLIIIGTCPVYPKGLYRDFRWVFLCKRNQITETPVSSISFANSRRTITVNVPVFKKLR